MKLEDLVNKTDALTYLNALKCTIAELKEELATIEEAREYQTNAIERARKIMKRMDNQYRLIVKSAAAASEVKGVAIVQPQDPANLEALLEDFE